MCCSFFLLQVREASQKVSDKASEIGKSVRGKAEEVSDSARGSASRALDKVGDKAHEASDAVAPPHHEKHHAHNPLEWVKDKAVGAKDALTGKAHEAKEAAGDAAEGAKEAVKDTARVFRVLLLLPWVYAAGGWRSRVAGCGFPPAVLPRLRRGHAHRIVLRCRSPLCSGARIVAQLSAASQRAGCCVLTRAFPSPFGLFPKPPQAHQAKEAVAGAGNAAKDKARQALPPAVCKRVAHSHRTPLLLTWDKRTLPWSIFCHKGALGYLRLVSWV